MTLGTQIGYLCSSCHKNLSTVESPSHDTLKIYDGNNVCEACVFENQLYKKSFIFFRIDSYLLTPILFLMSFAFVFFSFNLGIIILCFTIVQFTVIRLLRKKILVYKRKKVKEFSDNRGLLTPNLETFSEHNKRETHQLLHGNQNHNHHVFKDEFNRIRRTFKQESFQEVYSTLEQRMFQDPDYFSDEIDKSDSIEKLVYLSISHITFDMLYSGLYRFRESLFPNVKQEFLDIHKKTVEKLITLNAITQHDANEGISLLEQKLAKYQSKT